MSSYEPILDEDFQLPHLDPDEVGTTGEYDDEMEEVPF